MTREEAIDLVIKVFDTLEGECNIEYDWNKEHNARDMAIKALEQDFILGKIKAEIQNLRNCSCSCSDGIIDDVEDIIDKYKAESEDTVNKTGHWIDIMVGDMPAQACDQCNTFYPLAYTGGGHKYCPNCGTKMSEKPTGSESEG